MSNANALREQAARLLAEAGALDRAAADAELAAREAAKPREPEVGDEPVYVAFRRYLSGREYSYAAVGWRVGHSVRWAVTSRPAERANWPALLAFIGEANWPTLRRLTEGEALIDATKAAPVVERMGEFGRVESTGSPFTSGPSTGGFSRGGLLRSEEPNRW